MGILFSKIEKYFDKKYNYNKYNNYDYEYDSMIKNEENNQYDDELEDVALIYDNTLSKTQIDYYNKKLEGILYLS